jgi:hypothetical protein
VLGPLDPVANFNLTDDEAEALADLPDTLGDDRYAHLHAEGAAMTAEEILEYAHERTKQNQSSAP